VPASSLSTSHFVFPHKTVGIVDVVADDDDISVRIVDVVVGLSVCADADMSPTVTMLGSMLSNPNVTRSTVEKWTECDAVTADDDVC
jgi:hypothetical protein